MITRTKISGEIVFAGLLALVGLIVVGRSYQYGLSDEGRIGPGAFPGALGLILALLGTYLVLKGVRTRSDAKLDTSEADSDADAEEQSNARKAFTVLGMVAVAIVAAPYVGLIPALTVLIFLIALVIEGVGLLRSFSLAAICFALYYGIFELLLAVPMPGPF